MNARSPSPAMNPAGSSFATRLAVGSSSVTTRIPCSVAITSHRVDLPAWRGPSTLTILVSASASMTCAVA